MSRSVLIGVGAIAVCLVADPALGESEPIKIGVGTISDGKCNVTYHGQVVSEEELLAKLKPEQNKRRDVHIKGEIWTPYRCFGDLIFILQKAGFARIGLISEPEPQ